MEIWGITIKRFYCEKFHTVLIIIWSHKNREVEINSRYTRFAGCLVDNNERNVTNLTSQFALTFYSGELAKSCLDFVLKSPINLLTISLWNKEYYSWGLAVFKNFNVRHGPFDVHNTLRRLRFWLRYGQLPTAVSYRNRSFTSLYY